ncbi:hypothetical protein TNIN_343361 [Trichonephila inaurata madagascariensis]|uniref:Uncharacterized protein n=1 Tax=Trichonephila inaurata madagascariensis TaxID=2747483 RepID=A0A8X6XBW2_9ARAC|nr:hypothetical protein TNIN_343361 [Trichonephila inaurata madagascariensis]
MVQREKTFKRTTEQCPAKQLETTDLILNPHSINLLGIAQEVNTVLPKKTGDILIMGGTHTCSIELFYFRSSSIFSSRQIIKSSFISIRLLVFGDMPVQLPKTGKLYWWMKKAVCTENLDRRGISLNKIPLKVDPQFCCGHSCIPSTV